ncbi:MAG: hypothetical protein ICV60_01095 [Pyrinomonadaceae bacterium]|nr:hypothetical protein [Pyrinomonadaceae bacterium]
MNLRRYVLFLVVAILTFVIGVTAAVLVGHVNPFPRLHVTRSRNCTRLSALPAPKNRLTVYTVYRLDGTVVREYEVDNAYPMLGQGTSNSTIAPATPVAASR